LAGGLLTPLGASLISGTMVTAIRKVHLANGPWASKGGYEYNLVLLAIVFAVTDVGPGELSLDKCARHPALGTGLGACAAGRRSDRLDGRDPDRLAGPGAAARVFRGKLRERRC